MVNDPLVNAIKSALDTFITQEETPARVAKTRDGWAAWKGTRRITRWYFSEEGARAAAADYEAENRLFDPKPATVVDDPLR